MTTSIDLSRPRLRQVSHWIRDDLDPLVAREGPDRLRADDLLTLHDIFRALNDSSSITALDLRATGIHRAVMEIAGIATRWPGRLADDCDRLVESWTAKYGRLEDLHPFLYGRGGRLEGIASVEESSNAALLRRWQETCPDRISAKRARRRGGLGFTPGSWWINPMFACHAGIIDVETVDGGICHDKYGAYAILLTQDAELEAPNESTLTYRCDREGSGKFRLTAATPRSRDPLRVLRSHSVNSKWGPKAGVRYEGMYSVKGWSVHPPYKSSTSEDQKGFLANLVFDIHLERNDPAPMDEVLKYPTAGELDDYSEYKRLRKIYRESKHKGIAASAEASKGIPGPTKIAPAIPPPGPATLGTRSSLFAVSLAGSRTTAGSGSQQPTPSETWSSKDATSAIGEGVSAKGDRSATPKRMVPRTESYQSKPPNVNEANADTTTDPLDDRRIDIKEVAPWIEVDPPEIAVSPSQDFSSSRRTTARDYLLAEQADSPGPMNVNLSRNKSPTPSQMLSHDARVQSNKKGARKPILSLGKIPMAKLFDGNDDERTRKNDLFSSNIPRASSNSPTRKSASPTRLSRNSFTSMSPTSPLFTVPEAVILPSEDDMFPALISPHHDAGSVFPSHSIGYPLVDGAAARSDDSLPMSPDDFHEASDAYLPQLPSDAAQDLAFPTKNSPDVKTRRVQAAHRLEKVVKALQDLQGKVAFQDPFGGPGHNQDRDRSDSSNVSPETIP